jgi:hypothetical protein
VSKLSLVTCIVISIICAGPASAYLKVHPQNHHYFIETTTGKPVMIASCAGVVPTSHTIDNDKLIKEMIDNHITYGRVWHFLPWEGDKVDWPWARSSTPGAVMGGYGGNKFDMNVWNPVYWNKMRDVMAKCAKAGIYSEIHLFDRCGMSPAMKTRWQNNPWASDNNINDLETPPASGDGTPEFYMYATKPNLRNQQERYVRKMIDETIAASTVIYEIENEHWSYDNPDFGSHYAKFVKDYIAEKYPKSPRLVSYSSLQDDLEAFYTIAYVDIVNRHYGNEAERNPDVLNQYIESRWSKNKAINIDEFANGVTDASLLRRMCWTIVASGGNFHIEDAQPSSKPMAACENIRLFRIKSGWDFIHSAPNKKMITSGGGYCMARPGKEYVLYFPKGGTKTFSLPPGKNYRAAWWNTTRGRFGKSVSFSHAGGRKTFTTPTSSDWLLYVAARPNQRIPAPKVRIQER